MHLVTRLALLSFACLLGLTLNAEERPYSLRLVATHKHYNYHEPDGSFRVEGQYLRREHFGVRAHLTYGQSAATHKGVVARLAGTWWFSPAWSVFGEALYSSNDAIYSTAALTTHAAYRVSPELELALGASYIHEARTRSAFVLPTLTWAPCSWLNVSARAALGYTHTLAGGDLGGGVLFSVATFTPLEFLSVSVGGSVGNTTFDYLSVPGPLSNTLITTVVGGFELFVNKPLSLGVFSAQDIGSDGRLVTRFALLTTSRW